MARKFLTGADMASQRVQHVADPTTADDAATKQYVDNSVQGLAWKQPVKVATTTNGTLATAYANASTIDGVALVTGDRILIKDQTTGTENGIYVVNASGAPTRAADADGTGELQSATVYVVQGTINADKAFTQTANNPVIGTTALVFAQVGGGTSYVFSSGLTNTSGTITVNADGTSVIADGTSVRVNPAYSGLAKRYAVNVPTTGTTVTINHALGTTDVIVQVWDIAGKTVVEPDISYTDANNVTLTFAVTPTSGQYRCVVLA